MVKIDNVISIDFAKTPIRVLLRKSSMYSSNNSTFQIKFVLSQTFVKMIKVLEVLSKFLLVK